MALEVQGDKQLERLLKRLPEKLLTKVVRGAANRSMEPVRKEMKRRAAESEESGLLEESIGKKTKTYRRTQTVTTNVGPRVGFKRRVEVPLNPFEIEFGGTGFTGGAVKQVLRDPTKVAHLVEGFKRPARPHTIPGVFGILTVRHPGIFRPNPFARPAWDAKQPEAFRRYKALLGKGAIREAKKLGKVA